jgi:GNAT superfamily N-acetyltransferase
LFIVSNISREPTSTASTVMQRRVPPHPCDATGGVVIADGRQGIVLNVFTERPWRKRGLAGLLMQRVLAWAADSGLETLELHASDDSRRLFERLGFIATNEMRYPGTLLQRPKPG